MREIKGNSRISRVELLYDAMENIRGVNPQLAYTIQEVYDCVCRKYIAAYQGWVKDRRTFYFMN